MTGRTKWTRKWKYSVLVIAFPEEMCMNVFLSPFFSIILSKPNLPILHPTALIELIRLWKPPNRATIFSFFVTTISVTLKTEGWLIETKGTLYLALLVCVNYILHLPLLFKSVSVRIVFRFYGEWFFFTCNSIHESFLICFWSLISNSLIYSCNML